MVKRILRWMVALGIIGGLAIQLVPYGRGHARR